MSVPLTILVVDDHLTNRKLLRVILEAEGMRVLDAADGVEGLEILEREKVDAVISDILMPRMDGYRFCHEVRANPRFFSIPFIFHTATYTSPGDEKFSIEVGADKFIKKPAPAAVLLEALREAFGAAPRGHPMQKVSPAELTLMKEYNERLVAKLEQKNIELLLQTTALEKAANAVVITDRSGSILWVNSAFTGQTGYTAAEVRGRTPRVLKSGSHDQPFYRGLWGAILSGETWRGEFINRRKDGSLYSGEQTITPVCSEGGAITHFIGIMNDVTERKRAEDELRVTHEKLRELLARSPAVIYSFRLDGERIELSSISGNVVKMTGFSEEEAMRPGWWAGRRHAEESPAPGRELFSRDSDVEEYRFQRKDGKHIWLRDERRLVRDIAGRPLEVVGSWTDITERKNLEAQVLHAQRLESIGRLAAGVAHDLNNILAPILMTAPMLRWGLSSDEMADAVGRIEQSAQRGAQVVKQLLTLGRGVEGKRGVVQPRHVIAEMAEMARNTFPKHIEIEQRIPRSLWTITADVTQLHQVLLNLCVNARDAMPRGGKLVLAAENVLLEAGQASHPDARIGPYVLIHVKDTGEGIPPGIMHKVFDPFFTTKEPGKGTGLGLATVLGIVRSHGGFVEVESQTRGGAWFKVHLPATPDVVLEEKAESADTSRAEMAGRGEAILVVDDEASFCEVVRKLLERASYRCISAPDGIDGVAAFVKYKGVIKAVVCDLMMPGLDGLGVARILKKVQPGLPIIVSSGLGDDPGQREKLDELRAIGVKGFLAKPYTEEELLRTLHEVLRP